MSHRGGKTFGATVLPCFLLSWQSVWDASSPKKSRFNSALKVLIWCRGRPWSLKHMARKQPLWGACSHIPTCFFSCSWGAPSAMTKGGTWREEARKGWRLFLVLMREKIDENHHDHGGNKNPILSSFAPKDTNGLQGPSIMVMQQKNPTWHCCHCQSSEWWLPSLSNNNCGFASKSNDKVHFVWQLAAARSQCFMAKTLTKCWHKLNGVLLICHRFWSSQWNSLHAALNKHLSAFNTDKIICQPAREWEFSTRTKICSIHHWLCWSAAAHKNRSWDLFIRLRVKSHLQHCYEK